MRSIKDFTPEFSKYFKMFIDGERRLDASRKVLCQEKGFNTQLCFNLLDTQLKGHINSSDIQIFLQQYFLINFIEMK